MVIVENQDRREFLKLLFSSSFAPLLDLGPLNRYPKTFCYFDGEKTVEVVASILLQGFADLADELAFDSCIESTRSYNLDFNQLVLDFRRIFNLKLPPHPISQWVAESEFDCNHTFRDVLSDQEVIKIVEDFVEFCELELQQIAVSSRKSVELEIEQAMMTVFVSPKNEE